MLLSKGEIEIGLKRLCVIDTSKDVNKIDKKDVTPPCIHAH